jgi:hypothetical protein
MEAAKKPFGFIHHSLVILLQSDVGYDARNAGC